MGRYCLSSVLVFSLVPRCHGLFGSQVFNAPMVERTKRRHLRRTGKSDPIDAEAAARAVLAGEAAGVPKSGDGRVESIRTLRAVRRSAVRKPGPRPQTSSGALW